jgi:tetratricopeptide (TPR) repeat protein
MVSMPQRQTDGATGRRGDRGMKRRGEKFAPSLCRPVAPSLLLSVSLCLCVSVANSSAQAQSVPEIKGSAVRVTETLAGAMSLAAEILAIEDPSDRDAVLGKLLETGPASEQIQAAREAIAMRWAQLAESALARGDVESGMKNFRRAVAAAPERGAGPFFEDVVIRIPFALSARGYRNEAVEMAREIERRFAKEPSKLAALGEFYMTIEDPGDAIRALEAASTIAGEGAKLDRLLGAAYRMGLRLDDAIAKYRLATSLDANDKRAYYDLANLYRAQGNYSGAIELYRKQLEIVPDHSPSYKGLALAFLAQGDEARMKEALDQANSLSGSGAGSPEPLKERA